MDAEVRVRNLFGRAEVLGVEMEAGQHKSNTFRLYATKPRWGGADARLHAEVCKTVLSHQRKSSYSEKGHTASVSAAVGHAALPGGCHEVSYEAGLREVCHVPVRTSSWAVLSQRGLSAKSSLKHSFSRASLDDAILPTRGALLRLTTEVAGLGGVGDAAFQKHTAEARVHTPLAALGLPQFSLSVAATLGLLLPRRAAPPPAAGDSAPPPAPLMPPHGVFLPDRLFLGGPNSLWGFRTHGVGPREQRHTSTGLPHAKTPCDSLGGEVLAATSLSLSAPMPGRQFEKLGARAHAFASAGALHSLGGLTGTAAAEGLPPPSPGAAFVAGLRSCIGVGLAFPTPLGRLEVNLTQVLRRMPGDSVVRNGLQVGISPPAA